MNLLDLLKYQILEYLISVSIYLEPIMTVIINNKIHYNYVTSDYNNTLIL